MTPIKDINNNIVEIGHIAIVRYAWNSYVGEIKQNGLYATGAKRHAFFSPHSFDDNATYQIIGHINSNHPDYSKDVYDWYKNEEGACPVKVKVYKNFKL